MGEGVLGVVGATVGVVVGIPVVARRRDQTRVQAAGHGDPEIRDGYNTSSSPNMKRHQRRPQN